MDADRLEIYLLTILVSFLLQYVGPLVMNHGNVSYTCHKSVDAVESSTFTSHSVTLVIPVSHGEKNKMLIE